MRSLCIFVVLCIIIGGCGTAPTASSGASAPGDAAALGDTVTVADTASDATPEVVTSAARPDLGWDLGKAGPFGVGYRSWAHTYVPAPGDPTRTIGINLWYPSAQTSGDKAVYMDWWPSEVAVVDAKPTSPVSPNGYPVLVYSHGYSGFGGSSPWLPEHFASHGWVVIAPDHTGNMLPDNEAPKPSALWWWRARDVSAAIDEVTANTAKAGLAGKPLTNKVVLAGHSFGGYTTWCLAGAKFDLPVLQAACKAGKGLGGACTDHDLAQYAKGLGDPRVVAALPLMPGSGDAKWFTNGGMGAIHIPVLLMTGDKDGGHEGAPTWQAMQGMASIAHSAWLDVHLGCHQLFGLGMCGDVPKEDAAKIGRTYTLAFARKWLLGDSGQTTADVLSGKITVSTLVTLATGKAP